MDEVNERFTQHFISQNQILRKQRDQALNESWRAYKELEWGFSKPRTGAAVYFHCQTEIITIKNWINSGP